MTDINLDISISLKAPEGSQRGRYRRTTLPQGPLVEAIATALAHTFADAPTLEPGERMKISVRARPEREDEAPALTRVRIYTDGACLGNPGPGGWGTLVEVRADDYREMSGSAAHTTNQRMELQAALEALRSLGDPALAADVYSDSKYLVRGMREWTPRWQRNGWRTAQKAQVKNRDLWEALIAATEGRTVRWRWLPGHRGHRLNERADALARAAAHSRIPPDHRPRAPSTAHAAP